MRSSDIFLVSVVTSTRWSLLDADVDLVDEVVDLALGRPDDHLGVDQARRAHDLLDDLRGHLELVRARRRRHEHDLVDRFAELLEAQRPVVHRATAAGSRARRASPCGTGRPRTGRGAAGTVTWLSSSTHEEVVREVVEQRVRRLARAADRRGGASSSRSRSTTRPRASSRGRTWCACAGAAPRAACRGPRATSAARPARPRCPRSRARMWSSWVT